MESNIQKNQFRLASMDGLPISVTAWLPEKKTPRPVVIYLPGLKGFVHWGGFPHVCERIAAEGFVVLGIDFSRNGVVNFESEITRIDLAEGNSPSRQIEETEIVYKAIRERRKELVPIIDRIDPNQIFVGGHSLGGGTALRFAVKHPELNGIVTWASVSQLGLWPKDMLEQFERDGRLNMPNARTGQDFFLGPDFLKDIQTWGRTGIIEAARDLKSPLLLFHGDRDLSVPLARAQELYAAAGPEKARLVVIEGADHTFGAVHPFQGTTRQLERAIEETINWLQEKLEA